VLNETLTLIDVIMLLAKPEILIQLFLIELGAMAVATAIAILICVLLDPVAGDSPA